MVPGLKGLIQEPVNANTSSSSDNHFKEKIKGDASFSRFQFLIFTFIIGISLFIIIISGDTPKFPDKIPDEIFQPVRMER